MQSVNEPPSYSIFVICQPRDFYPATFTSDVPKFADHTLTFTVVSFQAMVGYSQDFWWALRNPEILLTSSE